MCELTTGFATKTAFPDDAEKFLRGIGNYDYESIALVAADEKETTAGVIGVLKANGCSSMDVIHGQPAAKKMWTACPKLYDSESWSMPRYDAATIAEAWSNRHNFVLPDAQLLIPSNQGKLWRDFNQIKPQASTWLAEQMRTRSCIDKSVGAHMSVVPGKVCEVTEVIADNVVRPFELYIRVRVFFMTLAYISITQNRNGSHYKARSMPLNKCCSTLCARMTDGRPQCRSSWGRGPGRFITYPNKFGRRQGR